MNLFRLLGKPMKEREVMGKRTSAVLALMLVSPLIELRK